MARIRRGVFKPLEEEANRLLKESMADITKHSEKKDVLTPWKRQARYKREIYVRSGVADPQIRRGMYHRAYNPDRPDLNSRDGATPPRSRRSFAQGLAEFVEENR